MGEAEEEIAASDEGGEQNFARPAERLIEFFFIAPRNGKAAGMIIDIDGTASKRTSVLPPQNVYCTVQRNGSRHRTMIKPGSKHPACPLMAEFR